MFSCTPQIFPKQEVLIKKDDSKTFIKSEIEQENNSITNNEKKEIKVINNKIINEIEVILPKEKNKLITKNFINALELSLYNINDENLVFNINLYNNQKELEEIIIKKSKPGQIFLGPLTSEDTKNINKYCAKGIIFFSFASDRLLGSDCIYLINFFPEDEITTLFEFFGSNKKVALLYPKNEYGYYINNIIDDIATQSESILVSKASYSEDLSDARESIKKLSKYELRKKELERQKKVLINKIDEISKKALKKIEKFETIGELDFTHIIISDYNVRLLQISPLLPFYDVDPNKIQFVGTGVWDDEVFFYEPSLQGAIFPGIEKEKRDSYFNKYFEVYKEKPIRTITIIFDLVGLFSYIINNNMTHNLLKEFLDDKSITFEGVDGQFSFENNLIKRKLNILKINSGKAELLSKVN